MASPTIVSTSPLSGAAGVPTNTTISVIFDQEIDLYRLKNGGIFLEGADESKAIGPGMLALEPPSTDEDKFLSSPGFKGIKDVSYTFDRVDGSGNSVGYYDYGNTSSAGEIYRTKVTLTPDRILGSLSEYTVYIVGDEDTSDEYNFGLTTRSVFDPLKGSNIGSGNVSFYGGYTGAHRQQFTIEITTAGGPGVAKYEWWTDTDSLHRTMTTSQGYRILKEGLTVKFFEGHEYLVGDTYTVWCDVPEYMEGSYRFSFTTSDSAPEELPVASTLLTGSGLSATGASSLSISETNPEDRAALISSDLTSITITFGNTIDATTISDTTVTVVGEAANGSKTGDPAYTAVLTKTLSVSEDILTITINADEVFDNNLIITTLDSTIADTDGNTLESDYVFFFGTEFNPYYATIRQVRLRLGSIGNSFPDETIAFAIWDASLEAEAFAPALRAITDATAYSRARQQFVVCFAAWILMSGQSASGESVRKRLSDFDVSRSPGSGTSLEDDLKACIDYYYEIMQGGGVYHPLQKPLNVVKGENDIDAPAHGRLWESVGTPIGNAKVLYSGQGSRRWYATYGGKLGNKTRSGRWGN